MKEKVYCQDCKYRYKVNLGEYLTWSHSYCRAFKNKTFNVTSCFFEHPICNSINFDNNCKTYEPNWTSKLLTWLASNIKYYFNNQNCEETRWQQNQ